MMIDSPANKWNIIVNIISGSIEMTSSVIWNSKRSVQLTHWGRVTYICVGKPTIIGSDKGLSPGRRQATIWTNSGILLIWPLGINFSEILIAVETFSFKKTHLKISSAKWRIFCLGLNVFNDHCVTPAGAWRGSIHYASVKWTDSLFSFITDIIAAAMIDGNI